MRSLILSFLICLAATVALAEKRIALVIGNGAYERIGVLANPRNDAALMADAFRSMGFDVTSLLDADEADMGDALDAFASSALTADVAAVYYAGHGIQYQRENYLMPVDARLKSPAAIAREGISLDQVMDALNRVPISLIFLDACRNNPFAEQLMAQAASEGRTAGVTRGLAVVQAEGDQLVAFATLPDTVALDGDGQNSPFAASLARHMRAPGLEVSVMMKRVTSDVMDATGGTQRPQQLSQMGREFYFAGKPDGPAPVVPAALSPILSVYPNSVGVEEEVAMIADLPQACTPFFFALAPSGKFTPIPRKFFKTVPLSNGQTRFEISPGSRYGLKVHPNDEKGPNQVGYICEPPAGTDPEKLKSLLRATVTAIQKGGPEDGTATAEALSVAYQVRTVIIR